MSLTVGAGVASADPWTRSLAPPAITGGGGCAQRDGSGAAARFNASPVARSYLRNFLAALPPQRAAMPAQLQALPGAARVHRLLSVGCRLLQQLLSPCSCIPRPGIVAGADQSCPASSPGLGQIARSSAGRIATRHRRQGGYPSLGRMW